MRTPLPSLIALALAACGPANTPARSPHPHAREVRIYQDRFPRCDVRTVGSVRGRTHRDIERAAARLYADAVVLEPGTKPLQGVAVVFVHEGCYQ
jgi:hypothetical protein